MKWFNKLFGKSESSPESSRDEGADPEKKVINRLSDTFGDYALHYTSFVSLNEAKAFLGVLSFMTVSEDRVVSPKNIQVSVVRFEDGVRLFIGGQISEEQNFEVLKSARSRGISFKSMAAAKETSLVYQEFIRAAIRMKEHGSQ